MKTLKMYKELNTRNCFAVTNTLQIARLTLQERYFITRDIYGNDVVFYTTENEIIIPQCIQNNC
jgi:hypothetical protein